MERKTRAWLRPRGRRLAKPKTPEGGKYISLGLRKWPIPRNRNNPQSHILDFKTVPPRKTVSSVPNHQGPPPRFHAARGVPR